MEYVSLYQFAKEKGVREQYIYGKFSADKIPKNCLVTSITGGGDKSKTLLIRSKAEEWWLAILAAREAKIYKAEHARKPKQVPEPTPKSVLTSVIQLTDSTMDPAIVDSLVKILEGLSKESK